MLKGINNSVPRWRVWAEVRRRRQQAIAAAQRLQQKEQQQSSENLYSFEESLFSPASSQALPIPPLPVQRVLSSVFQHNPSLPIAESLSQASFSPSPENLASLLDHLQPHPLLALQTLIWALQQPEFSASSPLLAPRIAPLLPLPKPPSVDRFLADVHAFWMQPNLPIPSPVVDPLLSLFCNAAATLDEIVQVFDAIMRKGGKLGVQHFNQVLQAAVSKQHNNVDKAQWLFKHMQKNGPAPDTTSYNSLIYGQCEAGNVSEAERVFDEMIANGVRVNEATYSSLISGIVKTGELDKALYLLREMKYNGSRPSSETYALVLQGLCKKGKHQLASSVITEMGKEGVGLDDRTYQALVSSLCSVLGVQQAEAHRMLYQGNQQEASFFG